MLRLFLFLLCVMAGSAHAQSIGPTNYLTCNKTAVFSGVTGVTSLIAGVSGKTIAICGWHVTSTSGTSATFQFTTGTQTTNPCDTGTVNITPALNVTSSAPSSDHIEFSITTVGNPGIGGSTTTFPSVCVNPSATGISGLVYYSQF